MHATHEFAKLDEAIRRFQSILDSPPSPASPPAPSNTEEIWQWAERARAAFGDVQDLISIRRLAIHKKWFDAMVEQDDSQSGRIAELKTADKEVEQLLDVVQSQILVLTLPVSEMQTDEEWQIQDMIDRGNELISWIRDHEDDVTSWFTEAFMENLNNHDN